MDTSEQHHLPKQNITTPSGNIQIEVDRLFQKSPMVLFIWGTEDGYPIKYTSENIQQFGYTEKEFIEKYKTYFEFIHPDDVEKIKLSIQKNRTQKKTTSIREYRVISANGQIHWVKDFTYRVFDHPEISAYGYIWDITESKLAEEAHQKSNDLYELLANYSSDGITLIDADSKVVFISPAHLKNLGYEVNEIVGIGIQEILERIHPEDRLKIAKSIEQSQKNGQLTNQYEYRARMKNGEYIWIEDFVKRILDRNNKILYSVVNSRIINDRKHFELKLEEQLTRLKKLHTIDNLIKSIDSLENTLGILLNEIIFNLRVDAVSIFLYDSETARINFSDGIGFRSPQIRKTSLKIGESFVGKVFEERKNLFIPDLSKSSIKFQQPLQEDDFVSYIGVPLTSRYEMVGVLEVFQRQPLHPDEDWLQFLELLADQAAIAILNKRLMDDITQSNSELRHAYDATIEGWSHALDLRDKETEGHTLRVTEMTMQLAQQMGIPHAQLLHIRRGALLHDIGKLGVPDKILLKPKKLTKKEWKLMRMHPVYAYNMLSPIAYLKPALDIPYCHHEKWDGTGYPRGLAGEQIPLAARIFTIVDFWDALTSDRPYRKAWSKKKALKFIKEQSGIYFDPKILTEFLKLINET